MSTSSGNARRRALLKTAGEMFLSQGFDAMSIDALIAQVGGSRRNVYDAYSSKEGLFEAVVRDLCEQYVQPIAELRIKSTHTHDALTNFAAELLSCVLDPKALALQRLMIAEGRRLPKVSQAIFSSGHERVATILAAWLVERQAIGEVRKDFPAAALAEWFVNLVVTGPQLRASVSLLQSPLTPAATREIAENGTRLFLEGATP